MVKHIFSSQPDIEQIFRYGGLIQLAPDTFAVFSELLEMTDEKSNRLEAHPYWSFLKPESTSSGHFNLKTGTIVHRQELLNLLQPLKPTKPLKITSTNKSHEGFKHQFDWSIEQFNKGQLKKTVPIIEYNFEILDERETTSRVQIVNSILVSLIQDTSPGYVYALWNQGEIFLGKTPEIIGQWSKTQKVFSTMALAGTFSNEKEIDEKIKSEHQWVVEDIQKIIHKDLNPSAEIKIQTLVHDLKNLKHLRTDFSIKDVDKELAIKWVNHIHPSAALGLYPRDFKKFENFHSLPGQSERGLFGAPLLFQNDEQIFSIVMIRGMQIKGHNLKIRCGCGVTKDSRYEDELSELELKKNSILKMAGLYEH